jgi:hypothetical protein
LSTQITAYLKSDGWQGKEILIILPTNLFGLKAIDWVHHHQISRGKMFATDVGDAWNIRLDAVAELLDLIAHTHDRVIVLTGDIHYAGAMEFSYQDRAANSTKIIQFTASPCKNEELLTRLLQSKLKAWLLPEFRRNCVGTFTPPRMQWQSLIFPFSCQKFKPDWWGKLRLIRAKSIELDRNISIRLYQLIRRYFDLGGEVIGSNNIAIVGWDRADHQILAIQDVYWIDRSVSRVDDRDLRLDFPLSIARYQIAIEVVNPPRINEEITSRDRSYR